MVSLPSPTDCVGVVGAALDVVGAALDVVGAVIGVLMVVFGTVPEGSRAGRSGGSLYCLIREWDRLP